MKPTNMRVLVCGSGANIPAIRKQVSLVKPRRVVSHGDAGKVAALLGYPAEKHRKRTDASLVMAFAPWDAETQKLADHYNRQGVTVLRIS